MRKANIISGIILFAVGLGFIFFIIPTQTSPGFGFGLPPAFLPTVTMIVIVSLSICLLLQSLFFRGKVSYEPAPFESRNWLYIGLFSALLFLSLGAITVFGFVIGGILMIAAFMFFLGERRPLVIALVSISTPIILALILFNLLKMNLP